MSNTLLNAALQYAHRGWSVIPTHGKKAANGWKRFQTQRPDEGQLSSLFAKRGITGLAVVLGSASGGTCCRDFDQPESYSRWAENFPALAADLPTVRTARGFHVFFKGPGLFIDLGDGEYRGDCKHYCVLPPSIHPTGVEYQWLTPLPDGDLPELDPVCSGLLPFGTERTERTERTQKAELNVEGAENIVNAENGGQQTPLRGCGGGADDKDSVENAIVSTIPKTAGQRNIMIFRLARHLKSIEKLATANPCELRHVVKSWHARAVSIIDTKEFTATWADFLHAWRRVKFAIGQGTVEIAFQRAASSKPPARAVELYDDESHNEQSIILLAALCRELQKRAGGEPFFLDCRTAGRLLGLPHNTAWRLLNVLCEDGLLSVVERGSQTTRKATRFKYIAD